MNKQKIITLAYPHQLFRISETDAIRPGQEIVLIEEPLFFTQLKFHQQKILLHRASMQAYKEYLESNDYIVHYLRAVDFADTAAVLDHIAETHNPDTVAVAQPSDYNLKQALSDWGKRSGVAVDWQESPLFLTNREELSNYFVGKDSFRMADFYKEQRRRMNILVDGDGQPTGGQWSFDEENRERMPKDKTLPKMPRENSSTHVTAARAYVDEHFPDNPGSTEDFFYPVTRRQALSWLDDFFVQRFIDFGPYEDAFSKDSDSYLWHSVITPFLNIGLVTPREVVDKALNYAEENNVPLNSLEGFIRQIIGWREFIHGLYIHHGSSIRTKNFFNHSRSLPESFWQAKSGIDPVDRVIEKVQNTAYAHHIERLMVLANFMTLTEFHPHDVYGWFMEVFIDSYDWVMVPNVYSMGLFADGGVMATKPYVANSNYITKMSDWKRDKDNPDHWSYQWDSLYWRFLHEHQDFFSSNPRLARITSYLDRMGDEKLADYRESATQLLADYDKQAPRWRRDEHKRLFD